MFPNHERDKTIIGALIVFVAAFFLAILIVAAFEDSSVDTKNPPFGCAYVDVDSTNGTNNQLACVRGYGWDR